MKKNRFSKGFALVEIVVVTLLLGGAFIVFIEALNQTKTCILVRQIKFTKHKRLFLIKETFVVDAFICCVISVLFFLELHKN